MNELFLYRNFKAAEPECAVGSTVFIRHPFSTDSSVGVLCAVDGVTDKAIRFIQERENDSTATLWLPKAVITSSLVMTKEDCMRQHLTIAPWFEINEEAFNFLIGF